MALNIGGLASGIGAVAGGTKTSCPKTVAGKLLGGLTGRNQTCVTQSNTTMIPNSSTISGSVQFGQAQRLYNWPIIAALVAVAYFIFKPSKRRRRR